MNLKKIDDRHVWHPYTQMGDWIGSERPVIVKGAGFSLVDVDGRQYIDGTSSMWCNVWGHGQNKVVRAMQQQLGRLQHSTLFGLGNETSILLAKQLASVCKGLDKVFYTDNGSTAIEAAMKMALQYWKNVGASKKTGFFSLLNGYHGDTVGAMSVGYIERFFGAYKPMLSPNVRRLPAPPSIGTAQDDVKGSVAEYLERIEQQLRRHGEKSAALVMESGAQIAGGAMIYPKGLQKGIAGLCSKYDVLLILDEIATGFGRLGSLIEYIEQESQPDIACFGKALTGGYFPLAVLMTSERIFDAFLGKYSENKQFYHGHTFTGHPVGCAAALANLDLYGQERLISRIRKNARYIASRLSEITDSTIVSDIRHKGMLAGIELAKAGRPLTLVRNERLNYFVAKESLKRGVHLRPLGNVLMVIPPLAIESEDLAKVMDVQLEVLRMVERSSPH